MILIHYHEIALKGKNRAIFEVQLVENLRSSLKDYVKSVKRLPGRIEVELKPKALKEEVKKRLSKVFGVAYFVFAEVCKTDIEEIEKTAVKILKDKDFETFKVETKRSDKSFKLTSYETSALVGGFVLEKIKDKKVNVKKPEIVCNVEITKDKTYLYSEKIKGAGGLPVGVSSRAIVLLSGGIDSPVAAHRIMKRGTRCIFVHFHSYPQTSKASEEKVRELANILNSYQFNSKLYLVPFLDIQKEIMVKILASYRVIMYRRFMLRIAEELAKKEKALGVVTGESIGQVASQTLENINVVNSVSKLPIFRPLIGYDKEEIIDEAKAIETFNISIQPHEDCCTVFIPKNPITKGKIKIAESGEEKLEVEKLVKDAISKIEIVKL